MNPILKEILDCLLDLHVISKYFLSTNPSHLIHPFGLARIITPSENSSREIFTNLNIITGGSFVPSAIQLKTTVKLAFLCPVDKIDTVLVLRYSTVVLVGKLNDNGVSSMFAINDKGY